MATVETALARMDAMCCCMNNFGGSMTAVFSQINIVINNSTKEIEANEAAQQKFNQSIEQGKAAVEGLIKKVGGIVKKYAGFDAIKKYIVDSNEAANNRISSEQRLQTIMGNTAGMTQAGIDLVKQQAKELEKTSTIGAAVGIQGQATLAQQVNDPQNIAALSQSMYDLAAHTHGVNVSQSQLIQTAELMNRALAGDISALTSSGLKIGTVLSEAEQQLMETGTEAERTAMVIKMIEGNLSGLAAHMAQTPAGQWQQIQNAFTGIQEKIGYGVIPLFGQLTDMILTNMPLIESTILTIFGKIVDAMSWIVNLAMIVANFIVDNWGWIEPIIWGIAAAMGAWFVATKLQTAISGIMAIKQAIMTAAIYAQTMAVNGLRVSWNAMNTAMKANVIILIISAVIGLVIWLLKLWKTNDDFAAGLMRAWNSILNFFDKIPVFFWQLVEWLLTPFVWWAEKVGHIYDETVNQIIKGINKVLGIVNKITGSSYEIEAAFSFENVAKGMKEFAQIKKAEAYARAAEKEAIREQRVLDNMDSRAAKRLQEEEERAEKFKPPELYDPLGADPWNTDNVSIDIDTIGRVDEVGKIQNSVEVDSEDLKMMRELAEMKNIQNFVSLTPTVSVQTGDVRQESDINTIVSRIETMLTEQIASSAQGVYG